VLLIVPSSAADTRVEPQMGGTEQRKSVHNPSVAKSASGLSCNTSIDPPLAHEIQTIIGAIASSL
jgi:hypothetical protein